jgi:hypothetical protein
LEISIEQVMVFAPSSRSRSTIENLQQNVADFLTIAIGNQLPFGLAIAQSELSDEMLRGNRANLDVRRTWTVRLPPEEFAAGAQRLQQLGYVSTAGEDVLMLEVPMAESGRSRMLDPTSETALLHVTTGICHPVAGVGYLGTIALPFDPPRQEIAEWCENLNAREHQEEDFVPRLGAWGVRGVNDQLVYTLFWPTDRGFGSIHLTMANSLIQRTLWLRNNFWVAKSGLSRREGKANG